MDSVSIKQLRDNLAQLIEEVAIGGKSIEVTKFGKPKAVIVPMNTDVRRKIKRDWTMLSDEKTKLKQLATLVIGSVSLKNHPEWGSKRKITRWVRKIRSEWD
ncbi:type II toxin-antitoxin system Phd/YefM family antitoxin [Candidatus Gottesmanbacteria bacterium]|nr:type II toxin-antitoxin system Phd/YefM family antitoxin [Candidatus Gottesmanbacteria bacterium]MBI5452418.1 type II toxin-antitoxin system Phd/YefM family antitoxin [Candidatus Gottesmanbacteria bacterium]